MLLKRTGAGQCLGGSCECIFLFAIPTSCEWAELDPLKVMGAICAIGDSILLLSCKLENRKISK